MIKNLELKIKNFSGRGVSLLYAVIILGTLALVSLAIAGLTIRGLKTSRDIGQGIAAYYAAESGLEDSLYNIYVNNDTSDGSGSFADTAGGWDYEVQDRFNQANPYTQALLLPDDPIEFDNISGPAQLTFGWDPAGGSVEEIIELTHVKWFSNFSEFTAGNQRVFKEIYTPSDLSAGNWILNIYGLTGENNLFRIKALKNPIHNFKLYIYWRNITDKIKIVATGEFKGHQKALEANFNRDDSASGYFDYVLFSPQDLVK